MRGHRPGRDVGAQLLQGGGRPGPLHLSCPSPAPPYLLCNPPPPPSDARHPGAAPCAALLGRMGCPSLLWGLRGWQGVRRGQRAGSVGAGGACLALTLLCPPQPVNNADFIIPVEIDGIMHQVTTGVKAARWAGGGTAPSAPSPGTESRPSALHPGTVGGVRVPGLARRGAEVGAHPPGSVGRWAGVPGAVPCCSGRPRVQVIQDRLWSGQSACSRLLGSGAGRTLRPGRASRAVASPQPTPGSPHGAGHRQPSASLTQQGAAGWAPGHGCPPGWAWGCWGGGYTGLPAPAARCPLPRARRCMCSSGRTWMSSCSAWVSSSSACSSPPAWPRWVPPPPATAIALPFPATPRVAQLPLAAHLWASVAPRPLRACRQCLPLPGAGQGN